MCHIVVVMTFYAMVLTKAYSYPCLASSDFENAPQNNEKP